MPTGVNFWVEYSPYIALIASGIAGVSWYFYQRSLQATDDRLDRHSESISEQQQQEHDLSTELKGVERRLTQQISKQGNELHQLRADVQSEHKDVWRAMGRKSDKAELEQHRRETNTSIESLRSDMHSRLDEMKELIGAKVEPIGRQVEALYKHMLDSKK